MITISNEVTPSDFDAWGNGENTLEEIKSNGFEDAFNTYAEECWPEEVSATEFNDWLSYHQDEIFSDIGFNSIETLAIEDPSVVESFVKNELGADSVVDSNGEEVDFDDVLDDVNSFADKNDIFTWYYEDGSRKENSDSDLLNAWWDENSEEFSSKEDD